MNTVPQTWLGWYRAKDGAAVAVLPSRAATKAECYRLLMEATELSGCFPQGAAFYVLPEGERPPRPFASAARSVRQSAHRTDPPSLQGA